MSDLDRRQFLKAAGVVGATTLGTANAAADTGAPQALLTTDELAYLGRFDTPTVANALEKLGQSDRLAGVVSPEVRCIFPEMGIMNGYAATATIQASRPRGQGDPQVKSFDYWDYIASIPKPTVMVIHDLDAPKPVGSWWGEVNANVHRALGCVGVITDGGVRDLSVVRPLGFGFFASAVLVSHGYVHVVDFGKPVTVGGVTIRSGDLMQADEHGAIRVPGEKAKAVGPACYEVFKSERAMIEFCQTPGVTVEKLKAFVRDRK
ncbi:MAG: twin-arginine translocation signal domain-containing protein [Phycisphaerae bacterium]|nr:twin-arginine translocation signal domain-containing protein [Phycisphaerae bacterium]